MNPFDPGPDPGAMQVLLLAGPDYAASPLEAELRATGRVPRLERIASIAELTSALLMGDWDLIVVDPAAPGFDAPGALTLLARTGFQTPFLALPSGESLMAAMPALMPAMPEVAAQAPSTPAPAAPGLTLPSEAAAEPELTLLPETIAEPELTLLPETASEPRPPAEVDALRAASSLLKTIFDSTAEGLLVLDREGRVVEFNRRFVEMWKVPDALLGELDGVLLAGHLSSQLRDPNVFLEGVRYLNAYPDADFRDTLEFKDGRVLERTSHPHEVDGRAVGRVLSFREVTQQRRLEEQLAQSHKLEAVGRLAGGVAHDFNNLLTAVLGYSDLVLRRLPPGSDLRHEIGEIHKAAERAASLTRQLLAFSRRQVLEPSVLDLHDVLSGMEDMLRRVIGEQIDLAILGPSGLGRVRADRGQIEQVVLNLAVNARDAMPDGGRLVIEAANVEYDEDYAREYVGVRAGRYVMLSVSDTGCGMDPETQARIFEPFFTTKEQGRGTGLGLATVYGIVHQSGGHIWADSEPGHGTTFRVCLPRLPEETARAGGASARGAETILLVEDEDLVRDLACEILQSCGYHVLEAPNADSALAVCRASKQPVELVVTDVVMPGMSGPQLVEELARIDPRTRVLYISGYAGEAITNRGLWGEHPALLEKPFTPEALVRRVREALDA